MELINDLSVTLVTAVWGLPLVFLLSGTALYFTLYYGIPQIFYIKRAILIVTGKLDHSDGKGDGDGAISHFQALCTALSATIGLGNIAGVAIAISAGGPGAVFWMWVAGFMGMATKFTSVTLALLFREVKENGTVHGGPMYTIRNGLGHKFYWLAVIYASFLALASFGAGNMFQANQMSTILEQQANIPNWLSGGVFSILAAVVLLGGIQRIASITSRLVPFMISLYLLGAIGILFMNIGEIPALLMQIVTDAFTGTAAIGGFAGVTFKEAFIQGLRRAVFSSEAGLGSASMAHAAAKSRPLDEGMVGLLEPFIDTIVVCTMTALVILITGAWTNTSGVGGSELTALAFGSVYGDLGAWLVTLTVVLFAFSTIVSWSYYGEQGVAFLFGEGGIFYYRCLFIICTFLGAILQLGPVLNFSDAALGLLAIPNILACVMLSSKVKGLLTDLRTGKMD